MAVSKLADLVIVSVRYEYFGPNQRIRSVQISQAHSRVIVPGSILSRDALANAILQGYEVITAQGAGSTLTPGQRVYVVQAGMYAFIRIDDSPLTADDLGVVRRI